MGLPSLVSEFVHRPQRLWLRRVNFQLHLWLSLLLTLYLLIIGLTGSLLVFREELENLAGVNPWYKLKLPEAQANLTDVLQTIHRTYPTIQIVSISTPTKAEPVFLTTLQSRSGRIAIASDAATGKILGPLARKRSWLNFVQDLHITLLLGPKGRAINGVGGAFLLLINITGLVIWWPGLSRWKRAFMVDFARRWRRINFDLHSALGFWTLAIVSFWALSGVYFGWSRQVFTLVNRLSPIISAKPPIVKLGPVTSETRPELSSLIARAYQLDPGTTLAGVAFPYSRRAPLEIFLRRGQGIGREYTDTLYFNPWDGTYIQTWRYGVNESLGDWFIWSQVPLHYGTYWGVGVKVLWAFLGLAIPLLAITGLLMYWNRVLRHKRKPALARYDRLSLT